MNFKKIAVLSFLFLACLSAGCTKKDKLPGSDSMLVGIDPSADITMTVGDSKTLRAVVRNSKLEEVEKSVRWSVSPSELGTFSAQSKSTSFVAENPGSGTITLTCEGVQASLEITVS